MKTNARLNSSRKTRERPSTLSHPLSLKHEKKRSLCSFCRRRRLRRRPPERGVRSERERVRDPERERILCSIFFDRKALAERETRRSVVVQDWKKRGKLRENLNLNTHHHQTDRHIIIALDCNNRRERERERRKYL